MTQLDRAAMQARNKLLAMFLLLCILDVTLAIAVRDRWAIGRILLTIVVMYFVMQGRKWARWLLIGICSLFVVSLIAVIVALSSRLSTISIVGSSIAIVLSAIIPVYMASSKDLNRYFAYKRQGYSQ
ncbi:hypothetical protein H6G17_25565 [Chroococcidiopsis sp. FACHB-1243]|uniref:hypothetical protein n=1 Tax=Chroococcidiopsis sp. [FACHB-1243] TaxID=2692781 RepID=UPI001780C7C0|nr:hypothetical protein [Chroococcidiopsis sp. [FACHB-1243]]MBD2308841.1 hypothetical protein [Chroococcidiopsis sp. [FACHB-1243]]